MKVKKGDVVARISYGKDILFVIDRIIRLKNGDSYAILKGLTIRIEADAPLNDIKKVEEKRVTNSEKTIEDILIERINTYKKEYRGCTIKTGRILHLDRW